MTKDRIVFFTSGDFATETFKSLIENEYNVVGLVTTASDDINSPADDEGAVYRQHPSGSL